MSFCDERTEEPDLVAPAGSYVDVEPPTEPDASPAPGLDLLLLSSARRAVGEAERYTAAQMPELAVVKARDAFRTLALVLAKYDRKELIERLVSDTSADRDQRQHEHAEAP